MNRTIWMYWAQGWDKAPTVVQHCRRSWEYYNPNWDIHFLDDLNLATYLNIDKWVPGFRQKKIDLPAKSDIIRMKLLKEHGGVWADATLWCHKPLDTWLSDYIVNNFFAFSNPGKDRLISSWFIAASKNQYMINAYNNEIRKYWTERNCMHKYFWVHSLFNNLYAIDHNFKSLWDDTPKIEVPTNDKTRSNQPHYFILVWGKKRRWSQLIRKQQLTDHFIDMINSHFCPVYKLTHRYKELEKNNKINYLFNTIEKT